MPTPDNLPPLASALASAPDARKLHEALAACSDEHKAAAPEWRILRDAYDGTGGFACSVRAATTSEGAAGDYEGGALLRGRSTYLTRFSRESVAHFTARADRSAYTNHIAPIVDTYHGHLARRRPKRDTTDAATEAWLRDVDGRGHDMGEWIAPVAKHAQLLGWRAALVDRMTEAGPDGTVRTVVRDLEPEEIRDWQTDQGGELEWCRLGSAWVERDPAGGPAVHVEVYTTWTRAEWAKARFERRDGEAVDAWSLVAVTGGEHDLGRVPVAVLRWQRSVRPRALHGVSQVAAVLPQALALFNNESEYADHLANQNFAFLAIEGTKEDLANLKLGVNEGMSYPQGYNAPQYVAPPSDVALQYALRSEQITSNIYALAKLERPTAQATGGDAASGIAKAYDFAATDAALQSFARNLTAFEYELIDLVARWAGDLEGRAVAATKIEWPQRFDARGIADDLNALFAILDEKVRPLMPPKAVALATAAVVQTVFPEATEADVAMYTAEIEAGYQRTIAAGESDKPKVTELFGYDLDAGLITVNQYLAGKGLPPTAGGDVTIIEWRVARGLNPDGSLPSPGAATVAEEVDGAIAALPPADRADPLNTATP